MILLGLRIHCHLRQYREAGHRLRDYPQKEESAQEQKKIDSPPPDTLHVHCSMGHHGALHAHDDLHVRNHDGRDHHDAIPLLRNLVYQELAINRLFLCLQERRHHDGQTPCP